jgi:hypothetical protein
MLNIQVKGTVDSRALLFCKGSDLSGIFAWH